MRNGDVAVKTYKNKGNVRGEDFHTFLLSYYTNGKRQLRRFMDFTKASNAADLIAQQKAEGTLGAAALSAADRVSLEQSLVWIAKIEGIGNASVSQLVEIVRDYATARADLPKGVALAETVEFFKQKHPINMPRKTVAELVVEFIADRRSAGYSAIHVNDLEIRLGQFSKAFELPINAFSAPLVQQWIYGLKNQKTKKDTAPRTKENMLGRSSACSPSLAGRNVCPPTLPSNYRKSLRPGKSTRPSASIPPTKCAPSWRQRTLLFAD